MTGNWHGVYIDRGISLRPGWVPRERVFAGEEVRSEFDSVDLSDLCILR